jgi:cytochrome c oxidase cbb3-type subunit 3
LAKKQFSKGERKLREMKRNNDAASHGNANEGKPLLYAALAMLGIVALGAAMISSGTIRLAQKAQTSSGHAAANGNGLASRRAKAAARRKFSLINEAHAASVPPGVIKMGERLYKENCEVCHQADAIGKPGVAPSLTNPEFLSIASDRLLMATIRDGREDTGMPPWAHLGRTNIRAIVEYLRSHQTLPDRSAEVDAQPDAHGDPRLGKQWYDNICSTCHGVAGNGYLAGGTGTAIGLKGFLNKVTDGFIRETVKRGRSNTRMRGFQGPTALANLSDQEIDDIIVYLRSLAK